MQERQFAYLASVNTAVYLMLLARCGVVMTELHPVAQTLGRL